MKQCLQQRSQQCGSHHPAHGSSIQIQTALVCSNPLGLPRHKRMPTSNALTQKNKVARHPQAQPHPHPRPRTRSTYICCKLSPHQCNTFNLKAGERGGVTPPRPAHVLKMLNYQSLPRQAGASRLRGSSKAAAPGTPRHHSVELPRCYQAQLLQSTRPEATWKPQSPPVSPHGAQGCQLTFSSPNRLLVGRGKQRAR